MKDIYVKIKRVEVKERFEIDYPEEISWEVNGLY